MLNNNVNNNNNNNNNVNNNVGRPVNIGDIVSLEARVVYSGANEADGARRPKGGQIVVK